MSDRPTLEFILPHSQVKLVLYTYLTIHEAREVKRVFFEAVKFSVDIKDNKSQIKDVDTSFQLNGEELVLKFLLKEAYTPEGTKVENPVDYVQSLPADDGDLLFDKINELSASSNMTASAKKN